VTEKNSKTGKPPDFSRRTALITIGESVAGFGVASRAWAEIKAPAALPPGVYEPSSDHLGHALMHSGRFHPIPFGCPTDYVRPRSEPFLPLYFSAAEFAVIRRLTQLILGETLPNTTEEIAQWVDLRVASAASVREAARHLDPLSRSLAVAYYGSGKVTALETAEPEETCRDGLAWLAGAARARGSDGFLSVPEEQQLVILDSISDGRPERQNENAGTRLFAFLKAEMARGYYTSAAGLKELAYKGNAFYARSPGCDSKTKQST